MQAAMPKNTKFVALSILLMAGCILSGNLAVQTLGIFLGSLLLWITVSIDWPSLITLIALDIVFGFGKTFTGAFGNSTVAFLLFTFALVYPLSKTNFIRRCAIAFITNKYAIKGQKQFVIFLTAALTFMGLFISPSVLFVAFVPFLEEIMNLLNIKKGSKDGNMLMMISAFTISLSSGMTAIGHVWPTIAMGAYTTATGNDINQFQYMLFGIPTGILIIVGMLFMFFHLYKPEFDFSPEKVYHLKGTVPNPSPAEKKIIYTLILTVALWVIPSLVKGILPGFYKVINGYTTAFPPLLGCVILSILVDSNGQRIMNFKDTVSKGILWGAVLMTGTASWLGSCLTNEDVGISTILTETLSPLTNGLPAMMLVLFFVVWAVIQTNFSSNIVTTTVVSSVVLSVTTALPEGYISVAAITSIIGFCAAICNMTPAGQSTINTVAIGSGWTDTKSMFLWGAIFSLIAIVFITFVGYPIASVIM